MFLYSSHEESFVLKSILTCVTDIYFMSKNNSTPVALLSTIFHLDFNYCYPCFQEEETVVILYCMMVIRQEIIVNKKLLQN